MKHRCPKCNCVTRYRKKTDDHVCRSCGHVVSENEIELEAADDELVEAERAFLETVWWIVGGRPPWDPDPEFWGGLLAPVGAVACGWVFWTHGPKEMFYRVALIAGVVILSWWILRAILSWLFEGLFWAFEKVRRPPKGRDGIEFPIISQSLRKNDQYALIRAAMLKAGQGTRVETYERASKRVKAAEEAEDG